MKKTVLVLALVLLFISTTYYSYTGAILPLGSSYEEYERLFGPFPQRAEWEEPVFFSIGALGTGLVLVHYFRPVKKHGGKRA